jgi:hypothetical protein
MLADDDTALQAARREARMTIRLHVDQRVRELETRKHVKTKEPKAKEAKEAKEPEFEKATDLKAPTKDSKAWRLRLKQRFVLKPLSFKRELAPEARKNEARLSCMAITSILVGAAVVAASFVLFVYPFHLGNQ